MDRALQANASRGQRILQALAQKDKDRLAELNMPKYDTTKVTYDGEREAALKGWTSSNSTSIATTECKSRTPSFSVPVFLTEYSKDEKANGNPVLLIQLASSQSKVHSGFFHPDNKEVSCQPQDQVVSTRPLDRMASIHPMDEVVSYQPQGQVVSTQPLDRMASIHPMDEVVSCQPQDQVQVVSTQPLDRTASIQPMDEVVSCQPQEQVDPTWPLDPMASIKAMDEVVSTRPLDRMASIQPMDEEVSPKSLDQMISIQPQDQAISFQPQDQVVSTQPLDRMASVQPMDEEVSPQSLDQMVSIQTENQAISWKPQDQVVYTQPMEQIDSVRPLDEMVSPQPLDQIVSNQPQDQVISVQPQDQGISTQPLDQMVSIQPMNEVIFPRSLDQMASNQPSVQANSCQPQDQVVYTEPLEQTASIQSIKNVVSPQSLSRMISSHPQDHVISCQPLDQVDVPQHLAQVTYHQFLDQGSSHKPQEQLITESKDIVLPTDHAGVAVIAWEDLTSDYMHTDIGSPLVFDLEDLECNDQELPDSHVDCNLDQEPTTYIQQNEQKITIQTSKTGKSKEFCCPFCLKMTTVLPRHLRTVHKNEPDVIPIFSEDQNIRLKALDDLRQRGIFKHNSKVEESGEGILIPKRMPKSQEEVKHYLPCDLCTSYIKASNLARHQLKCKKREAEKSGRNCNSKMRAMLLKGHSKQDNNSEALRKAILSMRDDEVSNIVLNDPLIKEFGAHLSIIKGPKWKFIKDKMRELGRVMETVKTLDTSIKFLSDLLLPQKYSLIVDATRSIAGFNESSRTFKVPTLAIKIGQSLKKCTILLKKTYLSDDDLSNHIEPIDRLQSIFKLAWLEDIEAIARRNLDELKWNKPERVPSSNDVKMLNENLKKLSIKYLGELRDQPTPTTYRRLAEVALCRTITFNRKRVGEVQVMQKLLYEDRLREKTLSEQVMEGINDNDLAFAKSLLRMKTRGKRDRGVSVMFTADMQEVIAELLDKRKICGIPAENPYLFPCGATSNGQFRAHDVLRKIVLQCNIESENAWKLTSTGLRKHVATVSQLLNLSKNELDCLAKYLGHDITVHRKYYRLTDESVELGKISKLLHLMCEGRLSDLKGRSLNELEIEDEEAESEDEEPKRDRSNTIFSPYKQQETKGEHQSDALPSTSGSLKAVPILQNEKSSIVPVENEVEESSNEESPYKRKRQQRNKRGLKRKTSTKRRNFVKRKPWSDVETSAVRKYFWNYILGKAGPNKSECELFLSSHGYLLDNRTYRDIVYHVHNLRKRHLK